MRPNIAVASAHVRSRLLVMALALALAVGLLVTTPPETARGATCPCSIFGATQTPTVAADSDTAAVELGVKFRADQAGFITGIRFYKGGANTGTHTGSLWSSAGTRLATVTFTGETASGWQQATLSTPVAIDPGVTYVASYYAPNGRYSVDDGFFASAGVVNSPLTALQDGVDGGNGVYRYGTGGGFPNSTFDASNYWVDVVFTPSGADTTKPTVTDRQPTPGATGLPSTTAPSATFSEPVDQASIVMTLTTGATTVPSTLSYSVGTRTATLTPNSSLATSTTYTVNLSGARDAANNQMDPISWTFTTASGASGCPCTIWPNTTVPGTASTNDSSAVELGVKFRASQAGFITGLRFYKGTGNTGTHLGSLWNTSGTKLGSVTFTGETATGWQQATLGSPVPVSANTTYVASYYAPVGRYSSNLSYFASAATTRGPLTALRNGTDGSNGVYRYGASGFPTSTYQSTNYWVDVVFDTTAVDNTAPTIASRTPAAGANGVATTSTVTATFSEPVVPSSVSMTLRGPGGALVTATTAYDGPSQTATLTPSAPLANSTTYTASVTGARDAANNTMTPVSWSFTTAAPPPPPPDQGPGGPIALVTSSSVPSSKYLAEIVRTEGLNEFATIDVSTLSPTTLAAYDVVVLGNVPVTAGQASALTTWVNGGGNLIAMRPTSQLTSLLGLVGPSTTITNGYLKVDNTTAPGAGIVTDTIQFHGTADRYTLTGGAQSIASLYTTATASTANPAVSLRSVGTSGGQAAAFTFDLAQSIIQTRQGNPAWAGTERDGQAPIRSDDMFFGGSQTDWVNLAKVAIPQADEQQRLLANLIQVMNRDKKPLPRFWYFPRSLKAVIIGTGDDHGNGGTSGRFDQYVANSPSGCSVSDWTCYRFSSYVYPGTPISNSAAVGYTNSGFEVGLHPTTNCANYTPTSIANVYSSQLASWQANLPGVPRPATNRTHCIVFSDWSSQPKVELTNGMRMDTNYYYWPGSWVQNRPGFMTGSGMPMRFTDTDGSMIDIYQATTQMTDESGQTYPFTSNTLVDNALGSLGYYGAFTVNMHTDAATTADSDGVLATALSRGVPIVSGKQMLSWIDGRNGSSYTAVGWSGNALTFTVGVGTGATGLTSMVPTAGPNGTQLTGITRGGSPVSYAVSVVKGIEYATFSAASGNYTANYGGGAAAVAMAAAPAATTEQSATERTATATVDWQTSKVASSRLLVGTSPDQLSVAKAQGGAVRRHSLKLTGLKPSTKYYYRVVSTDTTGTKATAPAVEKSPATFTTVALDRRPPTLKAPQVTPLPDGTVLLRWTTGEAATGVVRLGERSGSLTERAGTTDLAREHSVVLTGLRAGRSYWVDVAATDGAGNTVQGAPIRFVTPAAGVAQQTAAAFRLGKASGALQVSDKGLGTLALAGKVTRARAGGYVSGVLDSRAMVDWDRAIVRADVPVGSSLVLRVRTGSTAKPDGTWSSWSRVPAQGRISGSSRYIQYKLELVSPIGIASPAVQAIGFSNNGTLSDDSHEGR